MANDYDFQINDLKFRAAITDETPYQRATAPFRKEQFDAAPTVGDQSLTGWWTRGQLSFHKGAGIKFYEVLDGETILNRFQDSDAVDVWTAGQASLTPSLADLAVAATSATPGTLSGVAGLFYTDGSTGMKFYDGAGTTAITTSDSGVPTKVASDGRGYLAVNENRIEKQSYSGVERTNHVTNPNFETGTAGWAATGGSTIAVDATKFQYGAQSLKVSGTASVTFLGGAKFTATGLTAGTTYVASMWMWVPTSNTGDAHLQLPDGNQECTARDAWTRVTRTFTPSATSADIAVFLSGGSATTDLVYIDGVMLTEFPFDLDYFDGSTNGGTWSGTANASKSTYAESSTLRTNYVTNPNFETDLAGWSGLGGPSTLTQTAAQVRNGSYSMKVEGTSALGLGGAQFTVSGLTVGQVYVGGYYSYIPASSTGDFGSAARDTWTHQTWTFTANATTYNLQIWMSGANSDPAAVFYVDSVMVTEFPFEGDYFDGSTPGGAWTGTANASTSTYATSNPAASYALWEHGDAGYVFEDIWWAKGRIWAVDNTGRWYTLSPAGGTVHTTDALWTSGKSNGDWSLADSPSAVFIGEAGTIYSLTVDVDGAAVNLTAPVVAAILPAGENISSLYHYLGYLVITTNKGVRVAQVQDAQLIYGPLVITGDFSINNQTGAGGNLIYVVGQPTGHSTATVCVLDLTEEVTTLRPAWAPWKDLNNGAPSVAGALIDPANRLFAYAGNLYGSDTTMSSDGYIETGFHRFGTLDPKAFQTVSVRCGGDGGSITVARVDADGTVTTLGTVTPAEASKDFSLGLTSGAERVALRFTLTRDGTDSTKGPELLGYQIKALPVPERQRLLKWPLSLVDKTQLRRGMKVGKAGAAYTAVKALEALESSNAVVTYTDHRTGETGSAYVDAVEFQSNTPSTATSNGFGGVGYLTLRVLT